MPRDPFYRTRAAECAANIGMATLQDMGPGLFATITSLATGEVLALTASGTQYLFRWDAVHQELQLVERLAAPGEIQHVVLAA
jgi:hypothetical protein